MKNRNRDEIVAQALREYADFLIDNQEKVNIEQGRALDRALRSCKAISDIDVVWVRWRFHAESLGWITTSELVRSKKGCYYPLAIDDGLFPIREKEVSDQLFQKKDGWHTMEEGPSIADKERKKIAEE